jgi:hypothetical protein
LNASGGSRVFRAIIETDNDHIAKDFLKTVGPAIKELYDNPSTSTGHVIEYSENGEWLSKE